MTREQYKIKVNKHIIYKEQEDQMPPCQYGCPLHQDVRGYIYLIAQDRLDDAARLIRETNPLPGICGSICAHPCEEICRRGSVDQPLSIRRLKRYVMENAPNPYAPVHKKSGNGKRVAIIGSGPAGLTAAHDLAVDGYQVTVFEKMDDYGGSARWGVPSYRLPLETIQKDIQAIRDLGVMFKNNMVLGKNMAIESLQREFNAVILAMGLTQSRSLPIPNGNHENVHTALPFLRSAKEKEALVEPGDEVIVIGSGDVAMDVSRTAVRMDVEKVRLVCLEQWDEMPSSYLEKKESLEEGVEMDYCGWGPKAVILDENDQIRGLECKKCVAAFDEKGRFHPRFDEEETIIVPGNNIIYAIGQYSSLNYLRLMGIKLDKRGRLKVDKLTGMTSKKGIFSCGEVSEGPGLVVESMAHARRIASQVDSYLKHEEGRTTEELEVIDDLKDQTIENIKKHKRQNPSVEPVESRVDHFEEIEQPLTHDEALQETKRCLDCGRGAHWNHEKCAFCMNCVRVCPYEVPFLDQKHEINIAQDQCQSCGLCYSLCPANTIDFKMEDVRTFQERIQSESDRLKEQTGTKQLLLYCYYSQYEFLLLEERLKQRADYTSAIGIPCVGKLKGQDVFFALSKGYDNLMVIGCDEEKCTHPESSVRAHEKVDNIRREIQKMGYPEDKMRFVFVSELKEELKEKE